MLGAGFILNSRTEFRDGEARLSEQYQYQNPENSTLRFWLRGGAYLTTEFSAPRLLDDSPVNLNLATPDQVGELLEFAGTLGAALMPGAPAVELHKLNRLDYACDLAAREKLPGVIAAAAQFRFPGARKPSTHTYPGETATIRSSQETFRTYGKGRELEHKLSTKQRDQYADIIKLTKERGVTRMELSNRTRGGLALNCLPNAPHNFSERLESGFNGGTVMIGGLTRLEAEISSLGLNSRMESTLIKFAARYAVLGEDGMKERYSKPTFYRNKKQFLALGLRLDDLCTFQGEIDFKPVIRFLKAT
jgi:hypothetical protein